MYEHDTRYLEEMNTDPDVLIEIARERYYMKTDDEDTFCHTRKKLRMKRLNKIQNIVFITGAVLLLIGAATFFYRLALCLLSLYGRGLRFCCYAVACRVRRG